MTFSRLVCTGIFEVPWHQRLYDWTPSHVNELLQDLGDALDHDHRCYFLGTVILVSAAPRQWCINDGQQRLVTLSLICACLRRVFMEHGDSYRMHRALCLLFDIDENAAHVLEQFDSELPRIQPPRDDKTRYGMMIRGRQIGGNGKLTQAWHEIETFIVGMGIERSTRFFDFLVQRVEVSCLYIPHYVDVNAVYETINCRGKSLDHLDLLRNHLYSYFTASGDDARRDTVHENLERIRAQLQDPGKFVDYARCYFQSRYGFLAKGNFYKDARHHIQSSSAKSRDAADRTSSYVFRLVEDFSQPNLIELFRTVAIEGHGTDFLDGVVRSSGHAHSTRNISIFLRELHSYTVTQPLVFSLLSHYVHSVGPRRRQVAQWVHGRLKNLSSFVLRTAFVSPKFEPSHFESEFSNLAQQVMSTTDPRQIAIDECLQDCDAVGITDDTTFVSPDEGHRSKGQ